MNTFVAQILRNLPLQWLSTFIYKGDGLSVPGTILLAAVTMALVAGWMLRGPRVRASYAAMPRAGRQTTKIVAFLLLAALVLVLPRILGALPL